ncbi:MAG: hypothetical protein LBS08_01975 [Candidatus Symbiothrix sp.]|jgi:hypothetical protein|nr:hypothetical protein [Candidatus Symbiothrix sp.]
MDTVVENSLKKDIDWVISDVEEEVTLEDYRYEMKKAELSEKFTFEQFHNYMDKWLAENL